MSVDIIVVRGAGDRQGDDIISGLLSDINVALLRGAAAINDATPIYDVSLRTHFRPGVRNGDNVMVIDQFQGETWYGRVVGINHVLERPTLYTDLEVERFINV
jgi:hypothetical protein